MRNVCVCQCGVYGKNTEKKKIKTQRHVEFLKFKPVDLIGEFENNFFFAFEAHTL